LGPLRNFYGGILAGLWAETLTDVERERERKREDPTKPRREGAGVQVRAEGAPFVCRVDVARSADLNEKAPS